MRGEESGGLKAGGLIEDVGVPQQGNDEEIEENKDKERHEVRGDEEAEGRHDDRQESAEQVGCEQCGQWGNFTSGQSGDCPFYSLGYLYLRDMVCARWAQGITNNDAIRI